MIPFLRHRRFRSTQSRRDWVRETTLEAHHLIVPFFLTYGKKIRTSIPSMPGQFRLSIDELLKDTEAFLKLGMKAVLLFGIPKTKDDSGSEAFSKRGIVQLAVRALKEEFPNLIVITDLCFCEYTTHGHCGVIKKNRSGSFDVDNELTLPRLAQMALAQAEAGADVVAPSGMMDGTVHTLRATLDKKKFFKTAILSYSAKFSSTFYGPFREAAGSTPQFGSRQTYQMDGANLNEALREVDSDIREGADMVMVKPALAYLDIIQSVKARSQVPVVAYNVSGEYAMVKAAERLGWVGDKKKPSLALEILTSIKRAGADMIITYHASDVLPYLK